MGTLRGALPRLRGRRSEQIFNSREKAKNAQKNLTQGRLPSSSHIRLLWRTSRPISPYSYGGQDAAVLGCTRRGDPIGLVRGRGKATLRGRRSFRPFSCHFSPFTVFSLRPRVDVAKGGCVTLKTRQNRSRRLGGSICGRTAVRSFLNRSQR
jgi:hypothetical protein